jgi:hypothetical protein
VDFYVWWQTEKLTVNASGKRKREKGVTINKHKEDRIKFRMKKFREITKNP